jgi:hypothetical protein
MAHWERIRLDGKTLILRDPQESRLLGVTTLVGIEVDKFDVEVAPRGVDERQHIIEEAIITRRTPLKMNRTYGELEPA